MLRMKFDDSTKSRLVAVSRSRLVLKCSKHTRYNPAHGRGAIVGSCHGCEAAYEAYEAACALRQALSKYVTLTQEFETTRPRKKKIVEKILAKN